MVRGIGYGLIMLSCWALGHQAAGRLKLHRRGLKRLKSWLSCFRGKVLFEGATVEEALRESAGLSGAPFSLFFCRVADSLNRRDGELFSEIWEREGELCRRQFSFTEEEYADFLGFGSQLGQMDREVQQRAVAVYDERLSVAIRSAEEEIAVKEKLYRSLGLMAGCLIIILIW